MTPLYLLLSPNLLGAPDLHALHTQREVADLCERQAAVEEGVGGHESTVGRDVADGHVNRTSRVLTSVGIAENAA